MDSIGTHGTLEVIPMSTGFNPKVERIKRALKGDPPRYYQLVLQTESGQDVYRIAFAAQNGVGFHAVLPAGRVTISAMVEWHEA